MSTRITDLMMLALVALVFVFPSASVADLDFIGVDGRVWEYAVIIVLALAVLVSLPGGAIRDPQLLGLVFVILIWTECLVTLALVKDEHRLKPIFLDTVPYIYWLGLAVPVFAGSLRSWRVFLNVTTGAILIAAAIGAYALFFDRTLLAQFVNWEAISIFQFGEVRDIENYLTLSFRLPAGGVYFIPFLVMGWLAVSKYKLKGIRSKVLIWSLVILLILIVVLNQSRTTLIMLLIAAVYLTRGRFSRKLVYGTGAFFLFLALLIVGFAIVSTLDERLAARIQVRFVEGIFNPRSTYEGTVVGGRYAFYAYSLDTLEDVPILGRGLGSSVLTPQGYMASKLDVTILNHLMKSGLIGVILFSMIHLYLYLRMRGSIKAFKARWKPDIEFELRNLFVRYYPLLFIHSLNDDLLYKKPFLIVHGILVGSLLIEGQRAIKALQARSSPAQQAPLLPLQP